MAKCYVRNGVWAWSVQRQIEALGDLWEAAASFQDTLRADRAKAPGRVRPEWLTERVSMLRPSGRRQDSIHVATPLAIAVSEADLVSVLAAAWGRNASIVAHDGSGIVFSPNGDAAANVDAAVKAWQKAKQDARTEPGRLEGVRVAAARRRARTMKALKIATPLWRSRRPDRLSTDGVADECGLSVKTLYVELGHRPKILKRGQKANDEE